MVMLGPGRPGFDRNWNRPPRWLAVLTLAAVSVALLGLSSISGGPPQVSGVHPPASRSAQGISSVAWAAAAEKAAAPSPQAGFTLSAGGESPSAVSLTWTATSD